MLGREPQLGYEGYVNNAYAWANIDDVISFQLTDEPRSINGNLLFGKYQPLCLIYAIGLRL